MTAAYKTLLRAATDEYIVNKSRFLCHAAPAETEEAALAFLKEKREQYKDANHNCFAYIIGPNAGIMRYSDDGEPGGTAGLPMMEVLKARGVKNCCAVVTRYFGGILLGAGGLTRAYSHSCALALDAAGIGAMYLSERYMLNAPYSMWDRVNYLLGRLPLKIESTEFLTSVKATLLIKQTDAPCILKELTAASSAAVELIKIDELFAAWPGDEHVSFS